MTATVDYGSASWTASGRSGHAVLVDIVQMTCRVYQPRLSTNSAPSATDWTLRSTWTISRVAEFSRLHTRFTRETEQNCANPREEKSYIGQAIGMGNDLEGNHVFLQQSIPCERAFSLAPSKNVELPSGNVV